MAEEAGARRSHRGAPMRTTVCWVRTTRRRGTLPGADAGAMAEMRAGAAPGADPPDGIRALRRRTTGEARRREAGDLQLSGYHPHLWDQPPDRILHGAPQDDRQAQGSQAPRYPGEAARAQARRRREPPGYQRCGGISHITPSQATGHDGRRSVLRMWYQTLGRRSQRSGLTWERFRNGLGALLPALQKSAKSYPHVRFDARYPNMRGKNRVRWFAAPARVRAGGPG
jgi:hypothetical protein